MDQWRTAGYLRLSREDGDKAESDSIANQRAMLQTYIQTHPDLELVDFYQDDGYTGTHFDRPAFRRMEADLRSGKINCVLVKDLSRFGRDYIDMGRYLERVFPALGVRFIAINDHVDSGHGKYDILLPMKNIFNTQYARDISDKVRSAIHTKQQRGEFVGAFASYGYRKDPNRRGHLCIDPAAAQVVRRIFALFEAGAGKVRIAKLLNEEKIPSPSEYKRILGERYTNGRRLQNTTYWTYATIHRILQNRMYLGSMEQGRYIRPTLHGKAKKRRQEEWVVVENTHEAIISRAQWERVQAMCSARGRALDFDRNVSPFAGFLRCGDCGRAMVKTKQKNGLYYSCGSYKRYGPAVCTKHRISHAVLEGIILNDLNRVITSVPSVEALARELWDMESQDSHGEQTALQTGLERVYRLKKGAYEDYREGLLSKDEYLHYKEDYDHQEAELTAQLQLLEKAASECAAPSHPWVEALLRQGELTELDRITVAETVRSIRVFEGGHLEITYAFSNETGLL